MNILIDRSSRSGAINAFKRMSEELNKKNSLVIFPEGTRSKISPYMEEFKAGAFTIAVQKKVPILPLSFIDNWKRLQAGGFFKGKAGFGLARVIIHKPISTVTMGKSQIEALRTEIFNIIQEPILNNRSTYFKLK